MLNIKGKRREVFLDRRIPYDQTYFSALFLFITFFIYMVSLSLICTTCSQMFNLFYRGNVNVGVHTSEHHLEPVYSSSTFFVDGDYLGLSRGSTSAGYNYLDTNFLPSTAS